MSVAYYNDPKDSKLVESICNRLKIFFYTILYSQESLNDGLKRIVRASIISSEEDSFYQKAVSQKDSNVNFPFTAWSLGEVQEIDMSKINTFAKAGKFFYSEQAQSYVSLVPMKLPILFYHFFEKTSDYQYALSQLLSVKSGLTRFLMPINLNGIATNVPIMVDFQTSKGSYAHDFLKHLSEGRIFDIFQTVTVSYSDIILNRETIQDDGNGGLIRPSIEVYTADEMLLILQKGDNLAQIETLKINSIS